MSLFISYSLLVYYFFLFCFFVTHFKINEFIKFISNSNSANKWSNKKIDLQFIFALLRNKNDFAILVNKDISIQFYFTFSKGSRMGKKLKNKRLFMFVQWFFNFSFFQYKFFVVVYWWSILLTFTLQICIICFIFRIPQWHRRDGNMVIKVCVCMWVKTKCIEWKLKDIYYLFLAAVFSCRCCCSCCFWVKQIICYLALNDIFNGY